MSDYDNKPGGVLFSNNRKQQQNHPDFTGNIRLSREVVDNLIEQRNAGVECPALDLSAWKKQGNSGTFLSLSAKKPYKRQEGGRSGGQGYSGGQRGESQRGNFGLDDEIPF